MPDTDTLIIERRVRASIDRVFEAWTTPQQLMAWWGPTDVVCVGASIDLQVGGRYRIGNRLPDGAVIWIVGTYEEVTRPTRLVFLWSLDHLDAPTERVTVDMTSCERGAATDILVTHERIADPDTYAGHSTGWIGCLSGLDAWLCAERED